MTVDGVGKTYHAKHFLILFENSLNRFTNDTFISPILQHFTCA